MQCLLLVVTRARKFADHLATTNTKQNMIFCRARSSARMNRSEGTKKEIFPTRQARKNGDKARTKSSLSLAVLSLAKLTTRQAFSGAASLSVHGTILLYL